MKVRDLMSTHLVTLNADSDLELAEGLMAIMRIRHLPVVLEDRLVGLVTHRDLLRASLSNLIPHDPEDEETFKVTVRVEQIMQRDVQTIGPDADLREAVRTMQQHKYGCLPVVDDDGVLVGIVTEADFLRLAQVLLDRVADLELPTLEALAAELMPPLRGKGQPEPPDDEEL